MIKIDYMKLGEDAHTVTAFLTSRGFKKFVDWESSWHGAELWITACPEAEMLLTLAYGHGLVHES